MFDLVLGKNNYFSYALAEPRPEGIYLVWEIDSKAFLSDTSFDFSILRSTEFTNDISAYSVVATSLGNVRSYLDTTIPKIGKWLHYFYIVKLTTNSGVYHSPAITIYGGLEVAHRTRAKAIIRKAHLSPRHLPHMLSYILKRRTSGTKCTCIDPISEEILKPECTICYGTGYVGGYYHDKIPRTLVVNSPLSSIEVFDASLKVGSVTPSKIGVRFAGLPPIRRGDVFVQIKGNRRFYVTNGKIDAEINGFPLIQNLELQLADQKDIIYSFPLE